MKREIIKEYDGRLIILDVMLYCIIAVIGYILLNISSMDYVDPIKYAPTLFYAFGFFSILVYFSNRKRNDYELLIFGFINVCVGTFILVYSSFPDSGFILADAVLIYSIANVVNKGYCSRILLREKNINFFTKVSVSILLFVLGVLVVSSLYNRIEVGSIILGYYFIIFGLLSLLEPLVMVLTKNVKIEKYILEFLSYEEKNDIDNNKIDKTKKNNKKKNVVSSSKKLKDHKNKTIKK